MSVESGVREVPRKSMDHIDVHVGNRLRVRRVSLGLSQKELADRVGISPQQVFKYERAENLVPAERLLSLSRALGVPIGYFFNDQSAADPDAAEGNAFAQEVLFTPDALEMNRAFIKIEDIGMRRSILKLVRSLAG